MAHFNPDSSSTGWEGWATAAAAAAAAAAASNFCNPSSHTLCATGGNCSCIPVRIRRGDGLSFLADVTFDAACPAK